MPRGGGGGGREDHRSSQQLDPNTFSNYARLRSYSVTLPTPSTSLPSASRVFRILYFYRMMQPIASPVSNLIHRGAILVPRKLSRVRLRFRTVARFADETDFNFARPFARPFAVKETR